MNGQKMTPYGKIRGCKELGRVVRQRRTEQGATQVSAAGLANVGVRFLSELERGKETVELGKALLVMHRLGLEVWLVPRGTRPEEVAGSRGNAEG